MEKLPEKWCIQWSSKDNFVVIQKYLEKVKKQGWDYTSEFHSRAWVDNNNNNYGVNKPAGLTEITFDQFKKFVLGEAETGQFSVGDWVVITSWSHTDRLKIPQTGRIDHKENASYGITLDEDHYGKKNQTWHFAKHEFRLARPDEIPQTEVEYVECTGNYPGKLIKGKIYPVSEKSADTFYVRIVGEDNINDGFPVKSYTKPSTKEAYEAQQKKQLDVTTEECQDCGGTGETLQGVLLPTGHSEQTVDCPSCNGSGEIEIVNKCSTINQKQNDYSKESVKVQGDDFKIGSANPVRGLGIKSSGDQIKLGSNHSYNQKRFVGCKA